MWSSVYNIPRRDLTTRLELVRLTDANGSTLTLSGSHIVYVSDVNGNRRVASAARDVKVWSTPRSSPSYIVLPVPHACHGFQMHSVEQ